MAAEIQGSDIADKSAIEAPYQIKKGVDELIASIAKLKELTKGADANIKMAKSVGEVAKETDKLTLAQKELKKVNDQILKTQAQNNKEYQDAASKLAATKKEMKDAAMAAKTLSGSYNEFNKQVADAKKKLKEMEGGLEGASKEFKDLKKFVTDGTEKLKVWDKEIGDNRPNVGNYEGAIKDLKLEFKAAKDEMAGIARTMGTNSAEFQAATLKAGALKDEIEDLAKATKNVAGSKLENLSDTFGDAFAKLRKGDFSGALESAKQFATVAKSISFAEAGKSLKEFGQTMLTIGKAILTNPMFLIPAAIALVIAALFKFRDSIPFVSKTIDAFSDAIAWAVQNIKDFTDWLHISTFAIDEKAKKVQEATDKEIAALTKRYDREIALAEAAGKATTDLQLKKFESLKASAKAELDLINARYASEDDKVRDQKDKEFNREKELIGLIEDFNFEIAVINARHRKEEQDKDDEAHKIAQQKLREHFKELKKFSDDYSAAVKLQRRIDADLTIKQQHISEQQSLEQQADAAIQSQDMLLTEVSTKLGIMKQFGVDASGVQKIIEDRLTKQRQGDYSKQLEDEAELQAALLQLKQQAFQTANDLADNFFNAELIRIDARKNALETAQATELTAAGNNANAKASIESRYASQLKALDNEQRAVKRRQAIAQKTLAAFEIGVNTFLKASDAGFITPTAIAIYAAGALALASVLTKPIPAFKDGGVTETPLIVAGEEGTEAYKTPGGKVGFTPNQATVMRLPVGTEILNHGDTMRALALASLGREKAVDYGNIAMLDKRLATIEATQSKIGSQIVDAVRRGKTNFARQGSMLYEVKELENGRRKRVRAKSMGS